MFSSPLRQPRTAAFFFLAVLTAVFALSGGCGDALTHPGDGGGLPGIDGGGPPPGQPQVRSCKTLFTFHPDHLAVNLYVAGEWNGFDPQKGEMTGPDPGGNFTRQETLPPGSHGYKIVSGVKPDQQWMLDPANPYTKYVGGVQNSLVEVGDCKTPELVYVAAAASPAGAFHADVDYVDGADKKGLDGARLVALLDGTPLAGPQTSADRHVAWDGARGRITVSATGLAAGKHRLVISAADRAGHAAEDLHIPFWVEPEPFDFRDGAMYFAFTDRFRDGDMTNDMPIAETDLRANYQGGDFAGIMQSINDGYFDALGVRSIWISPPNANPDHWELGSDNRHYSGYHGYWPTDGRTPQKRFGDLAAMKAMVQAAHARGIRVLVDTVFNHVHKEHPYYDAHKGAGGWFNGDGTCVCGGPNCDWDGHRLDCWFTNYLPDINYENYDALQTMVDDALFWAREVDVDGFRVDAVKHFLDDVPRRLRAKLHDRFEHSGPPLFYTVGETFTGNSDGERKFIMNYVGPRLLHAQFDFPLYWAILGSLATYGQPMSALAAAAAAGDSIYGDAPMSPFLGNHDVPRFVSTAAGDQNAVGGLWGDTKEQAWQAPPPPPGDMNAPYQKLRMALAFLYTQPGVPLIYYGDEIGMPGAGDPDNRRMMRFANLSGPEQATLDLAKQAGAARRELVALRRGRRWEMWKDANLYVFARQSGSDVAVVAINRGDARTQGVPLRAEAPLADGTMLKDRLGGPAVTVSGGAVNLVLGTRSAAILAP